MTFLIAHAGHWLTTIAYFVPVVAFLVWLGITQIRERRRGRQAQQLTESRVDPGVADVRCRDCPVVGWGDDPYGRRMTRIALIFVLAAALWPAATPTIPTVPAGTNPSSPRSS